MKKLLMVMVLGASAAAASAQSLQRSGRTLGSRLARPTQTVSQAADSEKKREARKTRAAQRSQFSVGSLSAEFERERDTLFMDIVREAEICQTNLAMYATYPYWPDAMSVVSNFCEKENCVVVDVGHNFGSWKQGSWWQGSGKKAYVVRSNLKAGRWFVPQRWGKDGFCVISRGGSYTNVAYREVGPICCYDSDGRFVEMYDSLDKIPGMKQCFDDELRVNYGEQDRWMKTYGFAEEGSDREAENRLDAARTNAIVRLEALRTILAKFPQWKAGGKWYQVCDVRSELRGPSASGSYRPRLGGLRSSASGINTNDVVLVKMNERFVNLGHSQDQLIEEIVRVLTGLEFGSSTDTNGVLDLKFNLGSYENCTFGRVSGTGDVNRVTLIAEFDPSCEQKTIHEKLDLGLSTLLSAIGMDRDALTYNESTNGARPLLGGLRRPGGNQDWKSVQSFSQRFTISRSKQQSGEYVVTISDQRKVDVPAANNDARRTGGLLGGGSLRARRLQRQQAAQAAAAKQQEEQAARDAERQAQAELEKQQREAERAEQRQQLLAIQEELRRVREAKAAAEAVLGRSCESFSTCNQANIPSIRKEDFKAKLTGIAIIEGGRMCGYESRARKADFQSPASPMEIPYGKAACFRVEYDFPEGYQARVWTRGRWQKGQDGSGYYFGSNPSPLYKGKGIAYGFLDMLERGKTCTLKQLAIGTNAEPKLEGLSNGWDIVVAPVDIKFHGPETTQKATPKGDKKIVSNNQSQGTNVVADKLQGCDFLLNKDFKKNAKFYLCLFSASWCGPCRREMPRIAKTYAETLKDDPDIELIHFSRDQNDEKALAWAKEHDVKFPVVKPNGGNPLDLHSRGIPHLFIVKADGTLVEEGHPMRIFNEEKFRRIKEGRRLSAVASMNGIEWVYEVVNGGVVLGCGAKKTAVPETTTGELEIPETIDGMPVRSVGERAFYKCRGLTSVIIPSSVTNIEDWAFWGCAGLRSMTIPPRVKNIGDQAFYWCTDLQTVTIPDGVTNVGIWAFYANWKLTSVTIPASVVHIGKSAFCYCKGLRAINVAGGNRVYSSLDGILYNKARTELIQCPAGRVGSVTIPSSVTNIGVRAFDSCNGLTSLTIPVNVTHIADLAFSHCAGISDFIVPEGNVQYCSRDGILYNKAMTKLIQCPGKKAGTVSIPPGVATIGWCAFADCRELTSVEIPLSVTNLEQGAFSGCSGLTSVTIPSSVTSIGPMSFQFCGNIQSMTIPSSVTHIGYWAFRCKGLMSVTMLGERPKARTGVFLDCKKLTAIHVPANAKSWAGMKEWQGIPLVFDTETK